MEDEPGPGSFRLNPPTIRLDSQAYKVESHEHLNTQEKAYMDARSVSDAPRLGVGVVACEGPQTFAQACNTSGSIVQDTTQASSQAEAPYKETTSKETTSASAQASTTKTTSPSNPQNKTKA